MDSVGRLLHFLLLSPILVHTVPPDACFARFRWDDCGKPPTPVMYYWKPGSRCEVGIWRGCLPNPNMFSDEYACINTCIFVTRGSNNDILDILKYDEPNPDSYELVNVTEKVDTNVTKTTEAAGNVTEAAGNVTTVADDGNSTTVGANTTNSANTTTT